MGPRKNLLNLEVLLNKQISEYKEHNIEKENQNFPEY